jgi:phosphoserine aminotransferase
VLEVPADYLIGIVPGSDTGAMEMAMWSMLGQRPVQLLAFESFGKDWVTDVTKQLKLADVEVLDAPYGKLPDTTKVRPDADLVFTWNGTTSGVRVPNADFISADREGITICDATSAAFAQDLDWAKLDVVTFSWQKALGGEGAHGDADPVAPRGGPPGKLQPAWPMPKLFRMTKGGKVARHLRRRDDQHPVDALRRRLPRRPEAGPPRSAASPKLQAPRRPQPRRAGRLGGQDPWVDFLAETPRSAPTPRCASRWSIPNGRPLGRRPGRLRQEAGRRSSRRRAPPSTSAAIATPRPACASGAAPRSTPPTWKP